MIVFKLKRKRQFMMFYTSAKLKRHRFQCMIKSFLMSPRFEDTHYIRASKYTFNMFALCRWILFVTV